jgi:hypothetical protein
VTTTDMKCYGVKCTTWFTQNSRNEEGKNLSTANKKSGADNKTK